MSTSLGNLGESYAAAYLDQLGYRLVAANFTLPVGRNLRGAIINAEIDLIAYDGDILCFIEVKLAPPTGSHHHKSTSIYASVARSHGQHASIDKCSASKTNRTATTLSPSSLTTTRRPTSNYSVTSGPNSPSANAAGPQTFLINDGCTLSTCKPCNPVSIYLVNFAYRAALTAARHSSRTCRTN